MTINNCGSQRALRRQEIYSPQWVILCVMVHVMYNQGYHRPRTKNKDGWEKIYFIT